jgi:integrase
MGKIKVYGPYRYRKRWRLQIRERVARGEYREKPSQGFETEAEALAVKRALEAQANALTIDQALDAYERHRRSLDLRKTSIATTTYRLRGLLQVETIEQLTPRRCAALYTAYREGRAAATHRCTLREAKTFGKWLVEAGHRRRNPFADVKPVGKVRRGKTQLTATEAKRLLDYAVAQATAEPEDYHGTTRRDGAAGTLIVLLTGLCASELIGLQPRDVDELAQTVWVRDGKTDARTRQIVVPEPAWSVLLACAERARQSGAGRVFARSRFWVLYHVKRMCEEAEVTTVCAHALRGTLASLASSVGAVTELVARTLGHASTAVTLRHYATPESVATGVQQRGLDVLKGKKS